jgi:hypothetical protein
MEPEGIMDDYKGLKEELKEAVTLFEKPDRETNEKFIRKTIDSLYAQLKKLKRIKDPKVVTSCLGPHAVLAARFYNNLGIVEIHDHRGHLMSVHGDVRLQIGGYAMDISQSVRDALLPSGLLGEELIRRKILNRWVD